MASYLCTSCDHEFEHEDTDPRCPQCLRQNGVEAMVDERNRRRKAAAKKPRRAMLTGLVVATLALIVGGVVLHRKSQQVPRKGQLAILDTATLARTLRARGLVDADIVDPFGAGKAVAKLAGAAPEGDAKAQALVLVSHLSAKLAALEGNYHGQGHESVRTAEELASDLLSKDIEVKSVTSYEAAVLLVSALRQAGLSALLCEVFELDAPTRAADVVGSLGRYAVAIYAKDKLGHDPLMVFDPLRATRLPSFTGGSDNKMTSKAKEIFPLDDASAAAHLLALRALASIQRDPSSPSRAYELSQLALGAASSSATLRVARAQVLAQAAGAAGVNDATEELRKAVALRADAPRRVALSQLLMVQGDVKRAEQALLTALKSDPTFWPAHQTLASLYWMQGNTEGGRKHLALAFKAAPNEPSVMALKASALLTEGDGEEAVKLFERAVKVRPNEQNLLQFYVALLKEVEEERAKKVKKQLFTITRDRKRLETILKRIDDAAGVFDDDDDDDDDAPSSAPSSQPTLPPGGGFKLPDIKLAPPQGLPGGGGLGGGGLGGGGLGGSSLGGDGLPTTPGKPLKLPDVKLGQ
ncbi:MAG: tetratricopeptide repeat protein [Deltaproteobacteria bacterium]|nr:tetratricopeptide repeat protein [Deltaproteobacteria bacterium]